VVPAIKIVCEGDTDEPIITELLTRLVGTDFVPDWIWPERPVGAPRRRGGPRQGWKGVRRWCERQRERFGSLSRALEEQPLHGSLAVVIHVDADVARDKEVACATPCHVAETVEALRQLVLTWTGDSHLPRPVVLCIPSMATEAWLLAALHPGKACSVTKLECQPNPQQFLRGKRKLEKRAEARRGIAPEVAANWPTVCDICTQAQRFDEELRAALESVPASTEQ
jgi:hypothetical protein